MKTNYALANYEFDQCFQKNPLCHICDVCNRIWFENNLSTVGTKCYDFYELNFQMKMLKISNCAILVKNQFINREKFSIIIK